MITLMHQEYRRQEQFRAENKFPEHTFEALNMYYKKYLQLSKIYFHWWKADGRNVKIRPSENGRQL